MTKDVSPIIGIDLGTTNSLVALVVDGQPKILESREGQRLVPSVVSFATGEPVVGYGARKHKIRDASHTVFSVKRLLGRGYEDVAEFADTLPYHLLPGEGIARMQVCGRTYTAVEISAIILRELKASAESALGCPVHRAVITVPAYFNDSQRQATRMAGRLAGLDVLRIVNEPTAAALAYGLDRKKEGLIAVYDLGGGTFDISILKLQDGIFEVLSTNGDTALGGDDLDRVLVAVAAKDIQAQHGLDPLADAHYRAALIESAETVKIALSQKDRAWFEVMLRPGLIYRREFTRQEFEQLAQPLLERTREPCLRALQDAGLKLEDISDVVMVGGPTRLQIVQAMARSIFGRELNTSMHPDEVVAAGAAIQADILAGNNQDLLLLDVVPLSLGLETYGGLMSTLIPRNTRIPTVAREVFTTFVDRQTGVDIHVLQGEREKVSDNRSLARFKLKGIDPLPAGLPRIEVTFLIDADGILQVAAKDLKTGSEQVIEVRPSYGLSEDEITRMLQAQMENVGADQEYRKLVEARNEAEPVLRSTVNHLEKAKQLLPTEDFARIEAHVTCLRTALGGQDPDHIRAATHDLSRSTERLADLILKDTLNHA